MNTFESSLSKKDLDVLMDEKLGHQPAVRSCERIYSALVRAFLEYFVQAWGSQHNGECRAVGVGPEVQ